MQCNLHKRFKKRAYCRKGMLSIVRQLQYIVGKQVGQNEKIFVIDGQLLLKKVFYAHSYHSDHKFSVVKKTSAKIR